jgi:glutaredoxin
MNRMRRPLRSLLVFVLLVAAAGATAWGVREYERAQVGERVAAAVKPGDIEMYSATTCGICKQAKKWFTAHEIPVQSCEIDRDRDCAKRFWALKGKGTPLFVVRGERQVGFDRERIAQALER